MNYSIFRLSFDLHHNKSPITIPVIRGDTGKQIQITITDGGIPVSLAECSANLVAVKPNGDVYKKEGCEISTNRINLPLDLSLTDTLGITHCEVRLKDDEGNTQTTPSFDLFIEDGVDVLGETAEVTEEGGDV